MKKKIIFTLGFIALLGVFDSQAEKYMGSEKKTTGGNTTNEAQAKIGTGNSLLAGCASPNAATYIDFNNVKALIYTGGDMFWDFGLGDPRYEVPKGSGKHSMFLASLWLGGTDVNGQLRIAAQRYRSGGVDFWTGPLDTSGTAEISPDVCADWDKHFIITRQEVDLFVAWFNNPADFPTYSIPNSILEWPAHGDLTRGQSYYLAPFYDYNGDGYYNPYDGDYPFYDLSNDIECNRSRDREPKLFGDQTFWYIFNDKGNVHKETEGDAIGLEVHAQMFAFATNDEINNMLFTNYRIINRSTFTLIDTYFGTNFDPDIGDYQDDYVGCDVKRGLGYGYNGPAVDGSGAPTHYGENPPAIGVDFFEGPFQDPDNEDNPQDVGCDAFINGSINGLNFGDGELDNERWGMRRLVYYCNPGIGGCNGSTQGDPETAVHYYNFLRGYWKDGTRMRYGGNGHVNNCTSCEYADFMFPGAKSNPAQTDECNWGVCSDPDGKNCGVTPGDINPWTEQEAGNQANDRRFVHSAGPFTLEPGAENDITVGVVWERATSSDPFQSVELVRLADDKAQALFDNCFKVLNGPDAPQLTHQELNREIVLYLSNPKTSNNYLEQYLERDPLLIPPPPADQSPEGSFDPYYHFQGYQVYQLKDKTVSISDINNIELARLVAQVDVKDDIDKLVNIEYDEAIEAEVPTLMVNGNNQGISHSFQVQEDLFALGDKRLVNHKKYYFLAIAYAYNQSFVVDANSVVSAYNKKPYLAGRKTGTGASIQSIECIPHNPTVEYNGTQINSEYGDSPEITRIEGQGNGGLGLNLTSTSVNEILQGPPYPTQITYQKNAGPIDVKVVDPLNVVGGTYQVRFFYDQDDAIPITHRQAGQPPANISGLEYLGTDIDLSRIILPGHKFLVTGSADPVINGQYTVLKHNTVNNGPALYTEERIGSNLSDGSIIPTYKWALLNSAGSETLYVSDQGANVRAEQIIEELGIAITIEDVAHPGCGYSIPESPAGNGPNYCNVPANGGPGNPDPNNGFLTGTKLYADPNNQWLTGVVDGEVGLTALDWIRSGGGGVPNYDGRIDEDEVYEGVLGGTWAPAGLCSYTTYGPMFDYGNNHRTRVNDLASIDLVITTDKTKWTRAVVLELEEDPTLTKPFGSDIPKLNLRAGVSVDKNGTPLDTTGLLIDNIPASTNPNDPNYIANTGMGWFPGFAINVETGERLNIMFGEDSWLINGNDMIWNPTSDLTNPTGQIAYDNGFGCIGCDVVDPPICDEPGQPSCVPFWAGGKHFIYIMGHNKDSIDTDGPRGAVPAYDEGAYIRASLDGTPSDIQKAVIFDDVMWVGMPLLEEGYSFNNPEDIPSDVLISLRVARSYEENFGSDHSASDNPINENQPTYEFNLDDFATVLNVDTIAQNQLAEINVVPNPYNAFSSYESSQIDQRIKIINLPVTCTVTIYNLNGTLVRQYERDDNNITSIDWDLKNSKNVPIASGVYLIHVNAPGIGERTLKWFGVLRPIDLDSF